MADEELVKKFLTSHHHFELFEDVQGKKKVRCKLTGHELPCRLSDLERYTIGKKYQRLSKDVPTRSPGYEEYKKFLKPSEKQRHQLYCELTNRYINDAPNHIQRHVTGKRFTRALEKYRDQQRRQESSTQAEEAMWVPSDLESGSGSDSEIADDEDMNETKDSDDSKGDISSCDEGDSSKIKGSLKRISQSCIKSNMNNKKAKTEGEFQKDKLNTWPKKPKAKRSKAS